MAFNRTFNCTTSSRRILTLFLQSETVCNYNNLEGGGRVVGRGEGLRVGSAAGDGAFPFPVPAEETRSVYINIESISAFLIPSGMTAQSPEGPVTTPELIR